ncbi:PaaI family thioesterase [Novosphingobium sp.]|uniref:PaaI family thioesterase n=1 Tax=Novosphingobium sp. TaxID=1874826 RepID=UPI00260916E8|nr:PaaI family thioesterase [Novosphingobium sp.]
MTSIAPGIPDGFARHFRQSPVTDPWEPLYTRRADDLFVLALRIDTPHCNARGLLHGGVISALADNAMGLACVLLLENASALTINLSVDFLSTGKVGQWLEVRAAPTRLGKTLAFADARVFADDALIAKASGTFRIVAR